MFELWLTKDKGMAALWGNGGQGGQLPLEQWFYEMPPVTRWWTAATVVISMLVQCRILSPLQLFYSFRAVYFKSQVCVYIYTIKAKPRQDKLTKSVLANPDNIPLLWTLKPRPPLPRLLPTTILSPSRGILWKLPRQFFLAPIVRHDIAHLVVPFPLAPVPRHRALVQPRVHLESTQPGNTAELSGHPRVHGALSTLGVDRLQPRGAWHCAQG